MLPGFFGNRDLRSLTPGPSPFSSMNTTPAGWNILLTWLLLDSFAEPDAWSASIFFNELNTRGFKGPFYDVKRSSTWLVCVPLKLAHCYDADRSLLCEVLLTPIEKATRGPALFRCDHSSSIAEMIDFINSIENRLTIFFCRL